MTKKGKFLKVALIGMSLGLTTLGKFPKVDENSLYSNKYVERMKKRAGFMGKVADVKRDNLSVAQPLMDIYDSMNAIFDVYEEKINPSVRVSYIHDVSDKVVDRGAELIKSSYKFMEESMHNLIGVDISSLDSEVQSKIKVARNMLDGRHEARLPTPNDGSMNKYVKKFSELGKDSPFAINYMKSKFDIEDEPFVYELPMKIAGKFNTFYDGPKGLMIIPDNFEERLDETLFEELERTSPIYKVSDSLFDVDSFERMNRTYINVDFKNKE